MTGQKTRNDIKEKTIHICVQDDPYRRLAAAIVEQATQDYQEAITRIGGADADRTRAGDVYAGGREVTKDDGTVVIKYVETGIYSITETATLPGYVLDDTPSYFTVDEDGYVFMSDEKGNPLDGQTKSDRVETMRKDQYTRWDFSKVDMNGEELKGAKMQILDSEGNVATYQDDKWKEQKAEWTSDGTPHRISRLPHGNYTLHEEQSIEGYTLATDIPFEVTNTGVLCKVVIRAASLDDGKFDASGFDLVPVYRSLPVGYVNSFSHVTCPPSYLCSRGRGAAPRPPSACPEPANRDGRCFPQGRVLHSKCRKR